MPNQALPRVSPHATQRQRVPGPPGKPNLQRNQKQPIPRLHHLNPIKQLGSLTKPPEPTPAAEPPPPPPDPTETS
jgi:hypothetical protein